MGREKKKQHDVIVGFHKLSEDLGRIPTKAEFISKVSGAHYFLRKDHSEKYDKFLESIGLPTSQERRKDPSKQEEAIRKYKKLCQKVEKIQGHFRHILDLDEMFRRAGNPEVLKVSAQPDTHVKFMDVPAVNSYLKFIEWYKPDVHIIMGDFLDCEGLSHWPDESLQPRRIVPEAKQGRDLLQKIIGATPSCSTRIYLTGNHEHWIEMALSKMPELFEGLDDLGIEINLKRLLNLDKFGYELFPLNHFVKIGKAHFTHGIYTGDNHTKKHLSALKATVFYGHLHDIQSHNETSMDGSLEAASLGCLCRLDAKFLKGKPNNWLHAHGVFEFFRDGSFNFYRPLIRDGITSFAGTVFDGNEK
jgi:hypothetical protein